jgi:hypothetical protein
LPGSLFQHHYDSYVLWAPRWLDNEEPACMTQKTALRSIRCNFFLCWRRITGKILQGLGKRKQSLHQPASCLWNFHWKNWWDIENFAFDARYRELCIWCTMVLVLTKSFKNKCVILGQELTENNLRKWKVWSDRCQRRIVDKTCGFLIMILSYI